jgi:hypothetical protein
MIATSWLAPDTWREKQDEAIREAVNTGPGWSGPDWNEYISLVERHRTPALSWASLNRVPGITIPESIRQEMLRNSDECRMKAVAHCLLLADVLKRLNQAGIPVMPLKGQILSFALYGDVGLRQTLDMDLAVQPEDLDRAQACLVKKDWHLEESFFPMSPRQWDSLLRNESHLNFIHNKIGHMLELHWRSQWETPEAIRARWARSVPFTWQGCAIQTMSPGDLAMYLCSHGGLHQWFRAKWLGDLARAQLQGQLDWEAAFEEARRSRQTKVLLSGIYLLEQLFGIPRPNLPAQSWKESSADLTGVPFEALTQSNAPSNRASLFKFLYKFRWSRYERLLWPDKSWRDSLSGVLYCREDFTILPLPDAFFWAYKPLRPVLLIWRWAQQVWHRRPSHSTPHSI